MRSAAIRHAALAALHSLRPLGRATLGLSCGSKGTGMCLAAPVLDRFAWRWFTLAEDAEVHLALVLGRVQVDFAPEARVLTDCRRRSPRRRARTPAGSAGGCTSPVAACPGWCEREFAGVVCSGSTPRRNSAFPALRPARPGYPLPGLSLPLRAPVPASLAALSQAGQMLYTFAGLLLVHAPPRAYLALCYTAVYVVWKVGLYARVLLTRGIARWIRPTRPVLPTPLQHPEERPL